MTTKEERLRILKMVQNGQISAEDGVQLLRAIDTEKQQEPPKAPPPSLQKTPRQFRIVVTDLDTGQTRVDMRMPWSLIRMGIKMGSRFAREEIQLTDLIAAVESGAEGKIVDAISEADNERLEIFVEVE